MNQTLKVEGMSCHHCEMAVEKAVKGIAGVENVQVDLANKEVKVAGSADREQIAKAIEQAGYDVVG